MNNTLTTAASPLSASMAIAFPPQQAAPRAFGATRERPPFTIEWGAGFIDGDGCLSLVRQKYRGTRNATLRLVVCVTQNCLETLEHFRDGMGIDARIYKVRRTAQHNKQVYTLNYDGKKAMALIALLLPHLVRKQEEAKVALAYWVEGRVGMRPGPKGLPPDIVAVRERLYLKLRSLK